MAISPLGNEFKGLTFDGVSSKTYGVQILGKGVFNAPKRDVQMITIPGRSGDYALDKGRFENVEVTYPANLIADNTADFAEAISDFRNQLCGRQGYCRLEDEYNPDEYRLAVYKSGLEVTESVLKAGEFNIVFECKPQRWLTSGESAVTVGEWSDWETESGPIVEIEASETDKVKSLSVALEPIQEGSGTPSPDNVRPISGRTECVTYVSGINVWDEEWEVGGIDPATGANVGSSEIRSKNYIKVLPNTAYYCHVGSSAGQTYNIKSRFYDADKNYIGTGGTWKYNSTFTIPSGAQYLRFAMQPEYGTTYNHDISINYPSTDHDYHAYNGNTYTTDLGRTVYGGDVEVVGGALTDKWGFITFDGTENWYEVRTGTGANRALNTEVPNAPSGAYNWNLIGNYITPTGGAASMPSLWTANFNIGGALLIGIPTTITTVAEWKAYLAQNPLQLCYELATPQTYQLTPTEVALLKGQNNVWSDGDVTLEYGQDPNVIVNPTLFEASPLIECKGTGNIYLNSDQITINNLPIGDVSLASAKSSSTDSVSSSFNIDNAALLNPGDTITVASGCSTEVSFSWASSVALQSITPTISGMLPGGQVYGSLLSTTSLKCTTTMGAATFAYGTSSYYESTVSVAFEYLQSGTTYTKTCTYKVSCSYDGSNTITLSITNKTGASPFSFTSASACSLKVIKGTSTRLTTTDTIYIDLDIGEAYIINSGTITSINDIVSMPSKLPTIKPGTNTIIYANTITNLKITPRWWKV